MRRLFHVVLLVLIVIGVRTAGGITEAEFALGSAGRWAAQKTGLAQAIEAWDTTVGPGIATMTRSTSDALYEAVSLALNRGEIGAGGMAAWVADKLNSAGGAIGNAVPSRAAPDRGSQPAPRGADAPPPASAAPR